MAADLGYATATAVIAPPDSPNAGNWTATFTPSIIGVNLTEFECYRIVILQGPPGSTFMVYKDNLPYDNVFPGDTNSWDPNNAMKLSNGNTVTFRWNSSAGTPPIVWMYFREESPL